MGRAPNGTGYELSAWTDIIPESEIRRLLRYNVKYYFAGGKPGILPLETFAKILEEIGAEQLEQINSSKKSAVLSCYNYGVTAGWPPLRELLAKRLINDGIPLPKNLKEAKDKVVITTGSQQALFILGDILIDPGDIIITTEPVYLGFVGPMMRFGARIITVPTDDKGAIPEYVNAAIEKAKKRFKKIPDMIYVIPDSDNPKGTTIPMNRRKALYEIAEKHKILLIEDAAYREIQFQQKLPPIKSLDKENKWVVHIRTSSKEAAVFRIGYTVLPDDILHDFLKSKGYIDLTSPIINQVLLKKYYEKYFDNVISIVVDGYRRRCNAMEAAIDASFPPGWRSYPSGGFFIWWESDNKSFNARQFLEKVALKNDLSYVPGEAFYPLPEFGYVFNPETNCIERLKKPKRNTMRLSFSFLNEKEISKGINKLGNILSQHLKS